MYVLLQTLYKICLRGEKLETKADCQIINKKDKAFKIVNYCLMIAMTLLCIGLAIYYAVIGDPNNRLLATIGVSLLFVLPMLVELIFRCRISNLIVLCYVLYSILSGVLGCVFNFYNLTTFALNKWYDVFIHGLAGYVFCFIALVIISRFEKYKNLSPWTVLMFCLFFTLASELIWELLEWFADSFLGQESQGHPLPGNSAPFVTDTNIDMLCNFTGAVIFALHFIIGKFSKAKLGMNYIEKELCESKILVKMPRKNKKNNIEKEKADSNTQQLKQVQENVENQEDIQTNQVQEENSKVDE